MTRSRSLAGVGRHLDRAVQRAVALLDAVRGRRHALIVSAPERRHGVDRGNHGLAHQLHVVGRRHGRWAVALLGVWSPGGAVEHLVRARGVHICDRCVAQASEALAAAAPGQKVVRIRPASAHVGDREAAEAAVEEAFETVFNGQMPIEERCRAIENGDNLTATSEQARQRHPGAGPLDVSVDYVRFLSEDEAEVQFTL